MGIMSMLPKPKRQFLITSKKLDVHQRICACRQRFEAIPASTIPVHAAACLPSSRWSSPPVLVAMAAVQCHAACRCAFGRDREATPRCVVHLGETERDQAERVVVWAGLLGCMGWPALMKTCNSPARSENEYINYFCTEFWV
jgi:hypothetical protein